MTEKLLSQKFIYAFDEGDGQDRMRLGGKGANLCEMTQLGIPVPPGFTITTDACLAYLEHGELPEGLMDEVRAHVRRVEEQLGRGFGSSTKPLLLAVRSGSAMSMPGMMDTILNLGLEPQTLSGLIASSGDERFAYDAYRRLLQLFGKVALGVGDEVFDAAMAAVKQENNVELDVELDVAALRELSSRFKAAIAKQTGRSFPDDPYEQLECAIGAVFRSWMGRRAVEYRRQFHITPDMANGTAVNICAMVFGNMGDDCATGVAFTRNPATGENALYGEYLTNAQGEDVVAGTRTPKPVAVMEEEMPESHRQLVELSDLLERHYAEVQDFEFTIEKGELYCLQTRNGKMNARSMVVTSVQMANEGLIDRTRALLRVHPQQLEQLLTPTLSPDHGAEPIARGLAASPGAASGAIVFDADLAEQRGRLGEQVILLREETKPEDIHGFFAAAGILTSRGGKTSHAAVVARGMGKPCVSGCGSIEIDAKARRAHIGDEELVDRDVVTIDGTTGDVYRGELPTVEAGFFEELATLLSWADEVAELRVFANADTPADAVRARRFGAMGIGLCRTERMFNAVDRLPIVQEMILASSEKERQHALDRLLPIQRSDFASIFRAMAGCSVTVRLLDPPIHEFLPTSEQLEADIRHLSHLRRAVQSMGELPETLKLIDQELYHSYVESLDDLQASLQQRQRSHEIDELFERKHAMLRKVLSLTEVNPMLGHRGVRLGLTHPEIYTMQIRAILEAAAECVAEGVDVQPEIMVPQVCTAEELKRVRELVDQLQSEVEESSGVKVPVEFGTMIEVVRACMRAAELAAVAEFFSFGTNDLTQATFSFSREDAENKFLPMYNATGILRDNPFDVLDVKGVGQLMRMAVQWGRESRPELRVGICGEQGGHPESIRFCHKIGLNYVSCSAPRVPIARLAAAHAKLREADYGEQLLRSIEVPAREVTR